MIFDNSTLDPKLIARKGNSGEMDIIDKLKFQKILKIYENHK